MAEQLTHKGQSSPANARAGTLLLVRGMTCNNCARHVSDAARGVPGVRAAMVDLEAQQARVWWENDAARNVPAVLKALNDEGYPSQEIAADVPGENKRKVSGWRLNLALGLPVMLILMAGEWVFHLDTSRPFQWTAFFLAAIVQVFAGARFYRGAWAQLRVGSSNMDTLVALGSSTAFGYSTWALFAHGEGHLYFMESVAIITLISLGHWFEARMAARASGTLKRLLDLAPAKARKVDASGIISEVSVSDLKPGDRIELRPGDKVATDAKVIEGASLADESMLTGESAPVEKAPGALVYGGTVNVNGRLLAEVTAVGEDTALAHIVAAVQRAQTSRADIQRLGDKVSSVFVPVVVTIAVIAAFWWGFLPGSAMQAHLSLAKFLWQVHVPLGSAAVPFIIASAVLIIACPCAMGLATPAAIMAGSNAAAQRGILVRDGVALEKAGHITVVLFDKTGTLTSGKPRLEKTWAADGTSAEAVRAKAAQLARHSTHPISQAIATEVPALPGDVSSVTEVHGAGVQGRLNDQPVRLGSLRWLAECGVIVAPGRNFEEEWTSKGATVVGFAAAGTLEGLFAVRDALKPAAAQVVSTLSDQGLGVFLVTGDNSRTARAIAAECGIPAANVFAEVRPEHKAELIRGLQDKGQQVAFVGDGINDAPGLEQADLGIAVSRASDIAREAADIILLKSEIEAVPESIGLARATLRVIKQNLFWAFFYNAIGIPLAALGFMSPILCAAAMGFSDVIVIGNALRLRTWRLR